MLSLGRILILVSDLVVAELFMYTFTFILYCCTIFYTKGVYKPGMRWFMSSKHLHGFLNLLLSMMTIATHACVCACVSTPEAINN